MPLSVALLNPMADFGIDAYTHELARGLAENGVHVDVFTADASRLDVQVAYPHYRRFRVLGSRLPRILTDTSLRDDSQDLEGPERPPMFGGPSASSAPLSLWRVKARQYFLSLELALYLHRAEYDVVWTQWPDLGAYANFWEAARWLRMPVVHTVHNILPHERSSGDMWLCERSYTAARVLFVHSKTVRDEFTTLFPAHGSKVVTMQHGAYTLYPRRSGARARMRAALNIPDNAVALLCCGAIRPYKNVDGCIRALAGIKREDIILVIAGSEAGASPDDPLAQTRALVSESGVEDRARLLPGFLDETAMAELFEASDVLMLPYRKSYGSGLLMLGITFGKYIVATRPGMEEAGLLYPRAILLDSADPAEVARGIQVAVRRAIEEPTAADSIAPEFDWSHIAANCVDEIERVIKIR